MSGEIRLDKLLVQRGLIDTRSAAQAAIAAGRVVVDGVVIRKSAQKFSPSSEITAEAAHPYVSRGGVKLAHALQVFELTVAGRICLDLGASTGGFTEVLLEAGAEYVTAVDVGTDQFHPRLRDHPRLRLMEQFDVRKLTADLFEQSPDLVVVDLSFIGLEKAIGPALALAGSDPDLVTLFKPQFQVGRDAVGKRGVVRDDEAVEAALEAFRDWLGAQGWAVIATAQSPIQGGDGNTEYLIHARRLPE